MLRGKAQSLLNIALNVEKGDSHFYTQTDKFLLTINWFFSAKTELDIEEYCFSQTTLEQVFLKFAHEDDVTDEWTH